MTTQPGELHFTEDEEANRLLASDPMALLIGFLLDQQVTVMKAFSGPLELMRRVGSLDARHLAGMDADAMNAAFRGPPALHRFPGNMAMRTQELAAAIVERFDGHPERIWLGAEDGNDLERRLLSLPGIGQMKASMVIAILARRFDVRPEGWELVVPPGPTLADVDSAETLARYRERKAAHKAELRAKSRPGPEAFRRGSESRSRT